MTSGAHTDFRRNLVKCLKNWKWIHDQRSVVSRS